MKIYYANLIVFQGTSSFCETSSYTLIKEQTAPPSVDFEWQVGKLYKVLAGTDLEIKVWLDLINKRLYY